GHVAVPRRPLTVSRRCADRAASRHTRHRPHDHGRGVALCRCRCADEDRCAQRRCGSSSVARAGRPGMAALTGSNPVARWQKRGLAAALTGVVATGVIWLVVHYGLGAGNAEVGLPHWSEAWLIKLHGLAAFVVLVFVGAFLPVHVPRGWRVRASRGLEI